MKCIIPEISWHNRDPVLSVDIQPHRGNSEDHWRLASGGTDAHVLIWYIKIQESGVASLEFAADLTRHQKAVNVVRFSPSGELLASGDDESVILIWKQKTDQDLPEFPANDDEGNAKEQWISLKVLRGHVEDVYDLCWSPDSASLISGSVDNSAIFWDVQKGRNTGILKDHKGFVQGVAWDPQNKYVATMSSDRLCRIFNINTKRVVSRIYKSCLPGVGVAENSEDKVHRLYHDDTLKSFFRRLSFTPDGELLITPAGVIEQEGNLKNINVTYVYSRHLLNRPVIYLPTGDKYTIAVRCCPVLFELREGNSKKNPETPKETAKPLSQNGGTTINQKINDPIEEMMETEDLNDEQLRKKTSNLTEINSDEKPWEKYSSLFALPYRVVFAIATQNSVFLYDTQQPQPFAKISNIHYTRLTDITWSSNGRILVVSSTDGYCSVITFTEGELGIPYKAKEDAAKDIPNEVHSKDNRSQAEDYTAENQRACGVMKDYRRGKGQGDKNSFERLMEEELIFEKSDGSPANASEEKLRELPPDEENMKEQQSSNSHSKDYLEKLNNSSPSKDSPGNDKLASSQCNFNKTPGQELRKTPRRVQLITLSSPKSKKHSDTYS